MVFENILVGFDGSDYSQRALLIACDIASRFHSRLVVINVYGSPAYAMLGPNVPIKVIKSVEDYLEKNSKLLVRRATEIAKDEGVEVVAETHKAASVVQAIVDYATMNGVDLIVLGTRGLSGFKKLTVGSVSSGVVAHASCPVLVVR